MSVKCNIFHQEHSLSLDFLIHLWIVYLITWESDKKKKNTYHGLKIHDHIGTNIHLTRILWWKTQQFMHRFLVNKLRICMLDVGIQWCESEVPEREFISLLETNVIGESGDKVGIRLPTTGGWRVSLWGFMSGSEALPESFYCSHTFPRCHGQLSFMYPEDHLQVTLSWVSNMSLDKAKVPFPRACANVPV